MNSRTPEPDPIVPVDYIFQTARTRARRTDPELENQLSLVGSQLAVYLVCSASASTRESRCKFTLSKQQLAAATGHSTRQVQRTLKQLQASSHIYGNPPTFQLGQPSRYLKQPLTDKNVTLCTYLTHSRRPYLKLPLGLFSRLPQMLRLTT